MKEAQQPRVNIAFWDLIERIHSGSMRAAYIKKEALFNENDSEDEQIQKLEENYPGFFVSKVLKEGDSFGEIALQNHIRRQNLIIFV